MRIIDPHIHCYSRITDDYERMALAGIEAVVEPSFWLGSPRTSVGTYVDYFEHMIGYERQRAAGYGIAHFCTVSMNPKEANNRPVADQVVELLPQYLKRESVVALGEVGLDSITANEEEILRKQFRIAKDLRCPVLIHTPHQYKKVGVEKTLALIDEMELDHELIVMDHNTEETMPIMSRYPKMWRGITVYPTTKLSIERGANIAQQFGIERLLINSSADWGPSEPLSVPRVARELLRRGMPRELVEQLVFRNPIAFYSQSPQFTFKP